MRALRLLIMAARPHILLADDQFTELWLASNKVLVLVPTLVGSQLHLFPSVNIELSLEGFELGLGKVRLHDGIGETLLIMHIEGSAARLPRDNAGEPLAFCVFQHGVKLGRKGHGVE